MKYRWIENPEASADLVAKGQRFNLTPIQLQIFSSRPFLDDSEMELYINGSSGIDTAYDLNLLKDLDRAVNRISQALASSERIVIYGDYDVDGITSSALLYQFFQVYSYFRKVKLDVFTLLPERLRDGYGLKKAGIDRALDLKANLIITVDNGISSNEAIEYAGHHGVDVIVIDHHRVPDSPPPAYAIINPRQEDCLYPYKGFSAVGLVYKITDALSTHLLSNDERVRFLERYIDLVAIGTYQDMSPLTGENRLYVKKGIEVIDSLRQSKETNLKGLNELLRVAGRINDKVNHETLGFCIGPMINAAGRISSPVKAFKLLTTRNHDEARELALELKSINDSRRELTSQAFEEALEVIDQQGLNEKGVILLQSEKWHQGIIGLIAQRVSDRYRTSCIVLSNNDAGYYTGSARGYGSFDMGALIKDLKEYFIHHGGHKKAAGFSIETEQMDSFRKALYERSNGWDEAETVNELVIDASIRAKDMCDKLVEEVSLFEPFGVSSPEPVFGLYNAKVVDIKRSKRGLDSLICVSQNDVALNLVAFNETAYTDGFSPGENVDVAMHLNSNRGMTGGRIIDMRPNR
ncbi:MAG: hypothetical protein IEMM0008_0966 [bacterium]|nr:MAG: hypothetical protein IEMM0008_0966 [bacterium]